MPNQQQNDMQSQKQKDAQNLSAGVTDKNQKNATPKTDKDDTEKDKDASGTDSCGSGACS